MNNGSNPEQQNNAPVQTKKIMSYNNYLKHMKGNNCSKFKIYTCPLDCEPNSARNKMTYNEFLVHVKSKCKKVLI